MRGSSARTTQGAAEILAGLPGPVQAFSGDGSVLPLRIGSRQGELILADAAATRARRGLWLVVRSEDHEIELEIDSKNDYEYVVFEDLKPAGFEPLLVRSGYNNNDLGAYMELRDNRVCFFVRQLPRGKYSVAYRLRAEIPGKFSALPARASAMYAPELAGNSDETKIAIED